MNLVFKSEETLFSSFLTSMYTRGTQNLKGWQRTGASHSEVEALCRFVLR